MSNNERQRSDHDGDSFDVVNLGSVPPPPGADPHIARTAVAPLPSQLLEELRAKKNETTSSRRIRLGPQEGGDKFSSEAPTAPGKDSAFFRRPVAPGVEDVPPPTATDNLIAVVTAALAPATFDPPVFVEEPRPPREASPIPAVLCAPVRGIVDEPVPPLDPMFDAVPTPQTLPSVAPQPSRSRLESLFVLIVVAASGVVLGMLFERCLQAR